MTRGRRGRGSSPSIHWDHRSSAAVFIRVRSCQQSTLVCACVAAALAPILWGVVFFSNTKTNQQRHFHFYSRIFDSKPALQLAPANLRMRRAPACGSSPRSSKRNAELERGHAKTFEMLKMCTVYLQEDLTSLCDKCETIAGRCRVTHHANGDERQPTAGAAERASTTGRMAKRRTKRQCRASWIALEGRSPVISLYFH